MTATCVFPRTDFTRLRNYNNRDGAEPERSWAFDEIIDLCNFVWWVRSLSRTETTNGFGFLVSFSLYEITFVRDGWFLRTDCSRDYFESVFCGLIFTIGVKSDSVHFPTIFTPNIDLKSNHTRNNVLCAIVFLLERFTIIFNRNFLESMHIVLRFRRLTERRRWPGVL